MNLFIFNSDIDMVRKIKASIDWSAFGIKEVDTAYSLRNAEFLLKEKNADIILFDINFTDDPFIFLLRLRAELIGTEIVLSGKNISNLNLKDIIRFSFLDYLENPLNTEAIKETLELFVSKKEEYRKNLEEIKKLKILQMNRNLLKEQFWKNLCLGRISKEPEDIEKIAYQMDAMFDKDSRYELILVTIKNQDEIWDKWGEDICQMALQNLVRNSGQKEELYSRVIVIYSSVIILLDEDEFYGDVERCKSLIKKGKNDLNIQVLCYIAEPCYCESIPEVYDSLLSYSRNDVLKQSSIVRLSKKDGEKSYELILPNDLRELVYSKAPLDMVELMRGFLVDHAKKGEISEQNFRIFQQDILQMFFKYMDEKELVARELYDDEEIYRLYKSASQSIDDMCTWVSACIRHIKKLTDLHNADSKQKAVNEIKDYIRSNYSRKITMADISKIVHFSPDYITKIFKEKTGMTIREYIVKKRMEAARSLVVSTDKSISDVASFVGYNNASYFIRMYKKYYNVTPSSLRKRKKDIL